VTSSGFTPTGLRHRVLNGLRVLRRRPDLHLAVAELRHRGRRLHRRVRRHRGVVGRFDDLAAFGEFSVDVAEIARDLSVLLHRREHLLLELLAVERAVRAVFPVDAQLPASLQHRPRVVANDGDTTERLEHVRHRDRIEPLRLPHAAHLHRFGGVHVAHLAAEHGGMLDRRVDHAVTNNVVAELRLAGDDVGQVVDRTLLADEGPRRLRLELQVFRLRHRKLRRGRYERGVAESTIARLVDHLVTARRDLRRRHVPLRRRRGDQHRARGCARSSERLVEVADRARPVGVLVPVALVAESLLDGHPSPVCVELVGGDQWQRGADTSAHLRSVSDDEDPAIGLDAEIDARMQRRGVGPGSPDWLLRPCGLGQDARRDHERARGEEASDEPASGYVFDGVHAVALPLFAAPLMAARMR
jgi:hypothetical protein